MKKVLIIFGLILIICVGAIFLPAKETYNYDYLRLHIRANSNVEVDQQVKYEIKNVLFDDIIGFLIDIDNYKMLYS